MKNKYHLTGIFYQGLPILPLLNLSCHITIIISVLSHSLRICICACEWTVHVVVLSAKKILINFFSRRSSANIDCIAECG